MALLLSNRAVLPSCSFSAAASSSRRTVPVRRPRLAVVRAQEGGSPPPTQQQQEDDEARIAALEAAARARKGFKAEQAEAFRGSRPAKASSSGSGGMADWKEGQLFPEGWEEMDPLQKATELYMGKRGFLFWANKAALWSVGGLLVGWAIFRFVGPALGLYKLANDLSTPNLL
ncbi:hypothetical protein C2E21_3932 [Chlorella sorokiniana]|uniref:Uncharacterized protein n=1 Tax=Chlorella sorokiniana TaxID=3076 RepID=A0A2P6TTR7_CHLSO|nr:hypothetical protein C2E21_3932 [Chlorella sorokiniana]|eukprot:PRW57443.1 hypothetical protein C2E21_3932 [Chlorella sorokiniana]